MFPFNRTLSFPLAATSKCHLSPPFTNAANSIVSYSAVHRPKIHHCQFLSKTSPKLPASSYRVELMRSFIVSHRLINGSFSFLRQPLISPKAEIKLKLTLKRCSIKAEPYTLLRSHLWSLDTAISSMEMTGVMTIL